MPKGFTDFIYNGGPKDGGIDKSIPINKNRPPPETIGFETESYYINNHDGNVAIIKRNTQKLHKDWISFSIDVYEKEKKENKKKPGTTYNYVGQQVIKRCSSITKKGFRCMKPAQEGKDYCCVSHQNSEKVSNLLET